MIALIRILFLILFLILARVTPRVRIANPMVMDSSCRGGIAHIRFGCPLVSCQKGAKVFPPHIITLARREHDTKARSHALTRAMRKKKDDVSPQGLEPWSTGVITFT